MDTTDLLNFLHICARLKDVTRHCDTPGGRRESVAEHSWRLALMPLLLREEFPALNMDKVTQMCLLHDLGEAVTGDKPAFEKTAEDEAQERDAWLTLLDALPAAPRLSVAALLEEMAQLQTPEARLYKALDRMEALISHNEAPLSSWLPLEYDLQKTYGFASCAHDTRLLALREAVLRETLEKIAPQPPAGA